MKLVSLATLLISIISCGEKGSNTAPEIIEKEEVTATVHNNEESIFGRITGFPTQYSSLRLLVFDHVSPKMNYFDLSPTGEFAIPLAAFGIEKIYSFHLVDSMRWIGTLKFGTQHYSLIKYDGGLGFDLGTIHYPSSNLGDHAPRDSELFASIGGGFSLYEQGDDVFLKITPLSGIKSADLGTILSVENPSDLFQYFVRPDLPDVFKNSSLSNFTNLKFKIVAEDASRYKEARLVEYPTEIEKSVPLDKNNNQLSDLWSSFGFALDKSGLTFSKDFYVGKTPELWTYVTMRIIPSKESSFSLPMLLKEQVTFPAFVSHANPPNGTDTPLEFGKVAVRNGLTQPLCATQDISLTISPPIVDSFREYPHFSSLEIKMTYYSTENNALKKATPKKENFSSPYSEDQKIASDTSWISADQKFLKSPLLKGETKIKFIIPKEVVLKEIDLVQITEVHAIIRFFDENLALESISVVRLSPYCT